MKTKMESNWGSEIFNLQCKASDNKNFDQPLHVSFRDCFAETYGSTNATEFACKVSQLQIKIQIRDFVNWNTEWERVTGSNFAIWNTKIHILQLQFDTTKPNFSSLPLPQIQQSDLRNNEQVTLLMLYKLTSTKWLKRFLLKLGGSPWVWTRKRLSAKIKLTSEFLIRKSEILDQVN